MSINVGMRNFSRSISIILSINKLMMFVELLLLQRLYCKDDQGEVVSLIKKIL